MLSRSKKGGTLNAALPTDQGVRNATSQCRIVHVDRPAQAAAAARRAEQDSVWNAMVASSEEVQRSEMDKRMGDEGVAVSQPRKCSHREALCVVVQWPVANDISRGYTAEVDTTTNFIVGHWAELQSAELPLIDKAITK